MIRLCQRVRPCLAVLLCAVVGGCAVDQAKEVASYRSVINADRPIEAFDVGSPLTLERALELANHYNERLGLQGEAYLQSLINRQRAAANFMPTLSFAPSGNVGGGNASTFQGTAPLNARQNLFNGFIDISNYRAAANNIQQQRALLLDAQATVLLSVAQVYYQILRSEGSVEVLKNTLLLQQERVRDIRARQQAGLARPLDVAQTEAQASATRVSLLNAQNNVSNGRSTLGFLVGVPVHRSPLVDEIRLPETLPELPELQQIGAANRQDLIAAADVVLAARYRVDAAIGQYYPSVSLNLSYILARRNIRSNTDWTAAISANVPIFSAGLIEVDVREAWSIFRQAELTESQLRRQIIQDVEVAHQNVLASRERLAELDVQTKAADAALRLAEELYNAGLATNLERLAAQDQRLSAELQLASERFNYKLYHLDLLRTIGRLSLRLPGAPATRPATQPALTVTASPATMPS